MSSASDGCGGYPEKGSSTETLETATETSTQGDLKSKLTGILGLGIPKLVGELNEKKGAAAWWRGLKEYAWYRKPDDISYFEIRALPRKESGEKVFMARIEPTDHNIECYVPRTKYPNGTKAILIYLNELGIQEHVAVHNSANDSTLC